MKRDHYFLLLVMSTSGWISAQESVIASGGTGSGGGGSNTYSIGQVAYTEINGAGFSAIQGVQQPYEIYILSNDDHKDISLNIAAYPNPAISLLTLRIETAEMNHLRYKLFDFHGRLLRSEDIRNIETAIPMGTYEAATYILNVYSGQSKLKTFKIIKKNL